MKKNKNIYILYKVIRDEQEKIKDIEYLQEFYNYKDIQEQTHIHKLNIKSMMNLSYNNDLNTFKNYCIIKE